MKIYQIETSSYCNASCSYCPHPSMTRDKGNMSIYTFINTMLKMDNGYVALHHFGEPFLNDLLPLFIKTANKLGKKVEFSTNGIIKYPELVKCVMDEAPYMIRIAYDFARPVSFILTALTYNKSTILKAHSVDGNSLPAKKPFNNFAGAVEGESEVSGECYFKKYGYVCVLWNGDIVPCCQDFDGKEVIGTVFDKKDPVLKSNYSICKGCSGMQFADDGLWEK